MKRTTGMLATSRQIPWSFPSVPPPPPALPSSTQVNSTRYHTGISVHHQEKSWGSVSGRALVGELGKSRSFDPFSNFGIETRPRRAPAARNGRRSIVTHEGVCTIHISVYIHIYRYLMCIMCMYVCTNIVPNNAQRSDIQSRHLFSIITVVPLQLHMSYI